MNNILPVFSSHYSLSKSILTLDGAGEIDPNEPEPISIFTIAKKHGLKQVFIVEDNLGGFYGAYTQSEKEGIHLGFGLNLIVKNDENSESIVTIWMRNTEGYEDLLRINEYANYDGYEHPDAKITWPMLNTLMTPNLGVTIPFYSSFLAKNLFEMGSNCIPEFTNFEPVFLINKQGMPWDDSLEEIVTKYCADNGYKTRGAHDIYYYDDAEVEALQVFRCIGNRSNFEKPELEHFCSNQFSFESYAKSVKNDFSCDFGKNFSKYNIGKLTNGVRLPEISVSEEERKELKLPENATNFDVLKALTKQGLRNKILNDPKLSVDKDKYIERCKEELETFERLHLVDYILLVRDILSWAINNDIPVGPARGSSAGSLVAYLIDIVQINPMKYGLYFSRFISEARAQSKELDGIVYLNGSTMPDVDTDISYKQRHKVIEYIYHKYKGKTAKIGTTTTLTGKLLIKEVSKIYLNYSEDDAKHLADMIEKVFGVVADLKDAYEDNRAFKAWVNSSEDNLKCYRLARRLENLIKNRGQHPSGIAISYHKINELVPIVRSSDGHEFVTAYDMKDVANILVKVDILGLKTLDVLDETCKMVGIGDYKNIDVDSESIYNFLDKSENYHGLFQIEKGLGKNTILTVKPKSIHDYAACVAIGRPGAMKFIPDYAKYKETGEYTKLYDPIDKYLQRTGGIIIYQEQINEICQNVYQMSGKDADMVRYAIGKKKREEMEKWEPVIFAQGEKLGIPKEITDKFWATCNASADYLFNQSHSYAYGMLSAYTTFVKSEYPLAFFTCLLRMAKEEPDPMEEISTIQKELMHFGIKLLAPSIKDSYEDFTVEQDNIRYGLSAIKGLADAAQKRLVNFDRQFSNKFELFNNCLQARLGLTVVSSLILAGCFPDYGIGRARLLLEFQTYNLLSEREKTMVNIYSKRIGENLFTILKYLQANTDEKGNQLIKTSRLETIKRDYENYKKIYDFNQTNGTVLSFLEERSVLGYSYSCNLSSIYKREYPEIVSINEAITDLSDAKNTFIGIVKTVKEGKSREKKTPYIAIELEDDAAGVKIMAFKDNMKYFQDGDERAVEPGAIVVCRGKKMDKSTYFVDWGKVLWDVKLVKRVNQIKTTKEKQDKLDI